MAIDSAIVFAWQYERSFGEISANTKKKICFEPASEAGGGFRLMLFCAMKDTTLNLITGDTIFVDSSFKVKLVKWSSARNPISSER